MKPEVPAKFCLWVKHGHTALVSAPHPFVQRGCPTLVDICSKEIAPTVKFDDLVFAILHFVHTHLNDARACAKALMHNYPTTRMQYVCTLAEAQRQRDVVNILPTGFPELLALRELVAPVFQSLSVAEQNRDHDVCKVRVAVHLLKATRPDSEVG